MSLTCRRRRSNKLTAYGFPENVPVRIQREGWLVGQKRVGCCFEVAQELITTDDTDRAAGHCFRRCIVVGVGISGRILGFTHPRYPVPCVSCGVLNAGIID